MPTKAARVLAVFLFLFIILPSSAWAEPDQKGGKDHPLFTRMPGMHIINYRQAEFDGYKFNTAVRAQENVEGRYTLIEYKSGKDAVKPSALEIVRNHTAAITGIGGEVVYDDHNHVATMKITRDGKEIWAKVDAIVGKYTLTIVEKKALVQSITAQVIFDELSQKGFMVIDVHFDTAQAVIKPESQPLIAQVAEMLQKNPELKVSVEGHTDNVGNAKANQELSQARAKAVLDALTAKGIAPARLQAQGWGDQKPVADNRTEEGRAKNRRVELRKM
jgi:outer membrane protein OmpA-like peptidoglycan-associated protein